MSKGLIKHTLNRISEGISRKDQQLRGRATERKTPVLKVGAAQLSRLGEGRMKRVERNLVRSPTCFLLPR